jgi:hypothetical protein
MQGQETTLTFRLVRRPYSLVSLSVPVRDGELGFREFASISAHIDGDPLQIYYMSRYSFDTEAEETYGTKGQS